MNVSKLNNLTVVCKVREMHPGDGYMQHELELLENLMNETVDSTTRKGRKIGRRENTYETAKRLIQLVFRMNLFKRPRYCLRRKYQKSRTVLYCY